MRGAPGWGKLWPMSQSSLSSQRNARWGLRLFFLYLFLYAGFIGVNALDPEAMSHPWWGGVNVAIWSGMGLIAAAFGLAVLYLYHAEDDHHETSGS